MAYNKEVIILTHMHVAIYYASVRASVFWCAVQVLTSRNICYKSSLYRIATAQKFCEFCEWMSKTQKYYPQNNGVLNHTPNKSVC